MEEQLISFETAKLAKEKGFNIECLNFYTKPNSKMFGIDEHGRSYSIQNSIKNKIYTIGNEVTLNFKNVLFAPTQSLLQKWLRETHHLIITIAYQYEHDSTSYSYWIYKENNSLPINQWVNDLNTYEEALELGLQEALKLI